MIKNKRTSRARSPEKKAAQYEKILDIGAEMFVKHGPYKFSMRSLVKHLNMSQANLYHYVQSKRELWIAIRIRYYNQYKTGLDIIINENQGNYRILCYKIVEFFLEFASVDFNRFAMMYLVPAPSSKRIGPLEQAYKPFFIIEYLLKIMKQALSAGNAKDSDAIRYLYYLYGIVVGVAKVEADLKLHTKITEPIIIEEEKLFADEYRKFVLRELRDLINKIIP